MSVLQEANCEYIAARSSVLEQLAIRGDDTLFTDNKSVYSILQAVTDKNKGGIDPFEKKALEVLTARRYAILKQAGRCTDSNDARIYLESGYEAVIEENPTKKLAKLIALTNDIVDKNRIGFDHIHKDDPRAPSLALSTSLFAVTHCALNLYNRDHSELPAPYASFLRRAVVETMSTPNFLDDRNYANAVINSDLELI